MAVVREGLLAALMTRRGREMQPPSSGGPKATGGHPGRPTLPIAAVGLEGSCLGPYELDVPAEAHWWCVDLLGMAGGASVGPLGPPVSPSIAQYRPVFAQRVSSLDLASPLAPPSKYLPS